MSMNLNLVEKESEKWMDERSNLLLVRFLLDKLTPLNDFRLDVAIP